MLRTHEITEIAHGVFCAVLEPCSAAVLSHVLLPDGSHIWLVDHSPDRRLGWSELPVPISISGAAERHRVRDLRYDLQLPTEEFLSQVLPQIASSAGLLLLQLDRPVPDSLRYRDVAALPACYDILRLNGWQLTFELPHGGEYASLTVAARDRLEHILADPVIAAGKLSGELP